MKKYRVHDNNGRLFATAERTISDTYEMRIVPASTDMAISVKFPNTPHPIAQDLLDKMIKNISDHAVIKQALENFDLFIYEEHHSSTTCTVQSN